MLQIKTLRDASLADVIALYNGGIEHNQFSGWLDQATWETVIAGKPFYTPDDVLIAYADGRALGYIHLCNAPNADHSAADPATGSIEALFFEPSRPDVGTALIDAAVQRHRASGATKILGWSSFSGYPIYRGIFGGLEPMAMENDRHIVDAFLAAGFAYCQHSVLMTVNYTQPFVEPQPAADVTFTFGPWSVEQAWEVATWRGLEPYRNYASVGEEKVGSCLYALMPAISAKYDAPVGCIGGLRTHPDWRRKGIAALLVAKALNNMLELGARRVMLGTQADNWAAHATYRRFGMEIEDHACAFVLEPASVG